MIDNEMKIHYSRSERGEALRSEIEAALAQGERAEARLWSLAVIAIALCAGMVLLGAVL